MCGKADSEGNTPASCCGAPLELAVWRLWQQALGAACLTQAVQVLYTCCAKHLHLDDEGFPICSTSWGELPNTTMSTHPLAPQAVALQAVAVVQRAMRVDNPCTLMGQMGFGPLALVARFPVSMSGMCSQPAS